MAVVVSLAAAAGVVVVMERWLRAEGMRHSAVLAAVLLCTTWLFAHTAITDPAAMLITLFSTLSLSNFFFVYKAIGIERPESGVAPDPGLPSAAGHRLSSLRSPVQPQVPRATLPLWLFVSMLCGGLVGLIAPLTGIAAFVTAKRAWRRAWSWFGLREVLIFCVLCSLWLGFRWDGGTIFTFAPREHLFWYVPRLFLGLLPWTPVYLIFIVLGVWRKKLRSDMAQFLFIAVWSNFVVMSLIGPKSELYLLPTYPLIAYLTAALLRKGKITRR